MDKVGDPGCACLDEAEAERGKLFRNSIDDQRAKCREYRKRDALGCCPKSGRGVGLARVTVAGVNTDREVEPLGLLVYRVKVRVAGYAVATLNALLEQSTSAVVFGKLDLIDGRAHTQLRHHGHPAETA